MGTFLALVSPDTIGETPGEHRLIDD
jgi:hypothetical protein